jgi:adenosylhomocysteine nucleosidase
MQEQIIGIMGAMPEEINEVITLLEAPSTQTTGKRTYHTGKLNGTNVVVVVSGWGKVAAAATISTLIIRFNITRLIFTGVAGAINSDLKIGDIVLAKRLIQHDMDARPFIPRYEIPLTGKTFFETGDDQLKLAAGAIQNLLQNKQLGEATFGMDLDDFGISAPVLHMGDIASGDKFFSNDTDKRMLQESLPSVLCVEMEGAAVAQVCYENDIPFIIIRTISDASDDHSVIDFQAFIKRVASKYSVTIIRNIFGMA